MCVSASLLPICPLDSHNIAPSHCFSACSDGALNPPCIINSAACSRRHAFVAGVAVSTSCHHSSSLPPNTAHCPLLIDHHGRQDQANRRARRAPARYQHCDNYGSVRCRLTALIVSHDNSTVTSNRHPTLARRLLVARSMKDDTMLHGVMWRCPYRSPRITTGPAHVLTDGPSSARPLVYTLYCLRMSYASTRAS